MQDLGASIDVLVWSVADRDITCAQVLEAFELAIPPGSLERAGLPVLLNGDQVGRIEIGIVHYQGS